LRHPCRSQSLSAARSPRRRRKVVTYVQEQPLSSTEAVVQDQIVVGRALPETIVVTPVPDNPTYAYAVVNHKRVIFQSKTRKVVRIPE